jgi:Tfp pilus assembly protein PilV
MLFKKYKSNNNKQSGVLLIEVLIVAAILTVTAVSITLVAQKSITVSRQSLHMTQANFLLEEGAEVVRIQRDNAWANISGLTAGTNYYPTFSSGSWSLSTTPNTVEDFTRKITVANVNRDNTTDDISGSGTNDTGTRLVTVTVSWLEGAATVTKTLSFYILDIFS